MPVKRNSKSVSPNENTTGVLSLLQRYCAYQERCRQDIIERLKENEVPVEQHEHYLSLLIEQGFIDETRYARMFARGHFRQLKWGRIKIRQALKLKKISDKDIDAALGEISEQYNETLFALLQKKMERLKSTEDKNKTRQKLLQFALQKGFEASAVYDSLKKLVG